MTATLHIMHGNRKKLLEAINEPVGVENEVGEIIFHTGCLIVVAERSSGRVRA